MVRAIKRAKRVQSEQEIAEAILAQFCPQDEALMLINGHYFDVLGGRDKHLLRQLQLVARCAGVFFDGVDHPVAAVKVPGSRKRLKRVQLRIKKIAATTDYPCLVCYHIAGTNRSEFFYSILSRMRARLEIISFFNNLFRLEDCDM